MTEDDKPESIQDILKRLGVSQSKESPNTRNTLVTQYKASVGETHLVLTSQGYTDEECYTIQCDYLNNSIAKLAEQKQDVFVNLMTLWLENWYEENTKIFEGEDENNEDD
jgi:hypothetical protein